MIWGYLGHAYWSCLQTQVVIQKWWRMQLTCTSRSCKVGTLICTTANASRVYLSFNGASQETYVLIFCKEALHFPGRRVSSWVPCLMPVMGTREALSTSVSVFWDPASTKGLQSCPLAFNLILLPAGGQNLCLSLRWWGIAPLNMNWVCYLGLPLWCKLLVCLILDNKTCCHFTLLLLLVWGVWLGAR